MVQIVPKVPGFSERFGAQLGAGLSQGLGRSMDLAQQMALEKEKAAGKKSFYADLFGGGKPSGEMGEFQSLSPQQETVLALQDPAAFNAYQNLKQYKEKTVEKEKSKSSLESTLGEMIDTVMGGRLGFTAKRFGARGRRDVQYFNTLSGQLESIGKEMVSKGVLSQGRFDYLLGNLPSAGKSDATNAGAIEAWAKELNLNIPGIDKLKSLYEGEPREKPVKEGTPLTLEAVKKASGQAGGDKEKTKMILKKMGYVVE